MDKKVCVICRRVYTCRQIQNNRIEWEGKGEGGGEGVGVCNV